MIKKEEFDAYRVIVESQETRETLAGMNPDAISKLGGDMSVYYARLSNELALVKDEIMAEFMVLVADPGDGSKPMAAARADKEAELNVNTRHPVSRRQIEYLMEGIDKIAFACSARVRSFSKEGNF